MSCPINIILGDTITDTIQLRLINSCTGVTDNYPLEVGTEISLNFPGETSTVVLTTADSEVTIDDSALSTISFKMSPAKSALLKVGKGQTLDVIVTQGITDDVKTSQILKILNISARANV